MTTMLISLLVGTVTLSVVQGCCLPNKMETFEFLEMETMVNNRPRVTRAAVYLAIDSDAHKTFSNISATVDGVTSQELVIQDYPKGYQFVIKGTECKKTPLGPWQRPCLPPDAVEEARGYVGLMGRELSVSTYKFKDGMNTGYVQLADGCIPVGENAHGMTSNGSPFKMDILFLNATLGISNPSVFVEPSICDHARLINVPHQHSGSFFMNV